MKNKENKGENVEIPEVATGFAWSQFPLKKNLDQTELRASTRGQDQCQTGETAYSLFMSEPGTIVIKKKHLEQTPWENVSLRWMETEESL